MTSSSPDIPSTIETVRLSRSGMASVALPLVGVFAWFVLMSGALRAGFLAAHWANVQSQTREMLTNAFVVGLRFDVAVAAYLLLPVAVIYFASSSDPLNRRVRGLIQAFVVLAAVLVAVFWLADIQYFNDAGKHFTYEAFEFLNLDLVPIVSSAFELHPWLCYFSIGVCLAIGLISAVTVGWTMRRWARPVPARARAILCACTFALLVIGTRGGLQARPLQIGDSFISGSPYLNAVALNPIFSAFGTVVARSERAAVLDEKASVAAVRSRLGISSAESALLEFPLVRESAGSAQGNRKNVIVLLLESWTGKDVGALGGSLGVTPFFDRLARSGLLFPNFYASGIRSPEGIFSTLCSFPNQPLIPIMTRPETKTTNWRPLSQILVEKGYRSVFVHGSDLRFDGLEDYLRAIHFQRIIDVRDFPPEEYDQVAWGVNDEVVLRKADEEFDREKEKPFFGVVYTLNTHPPFTVPDTFPILLPPTSDSNRYVNALKYSDSSLEAFFRVAASHEYFKNTVFVLVSDHTRTRDSFNFASQHRIPFLLYSPDGSLAGINPVVGGHLDILPTILGLLDLKATHASWGRNLLTTPQDDGFAVSVVGTDVKWQDNRYILVDNRTDSGNPFLCDINADLECDQNVWDRHTEDGRARKNVLRSYISLSQALLYGDRVFPRAVHQQ